MALLSVSVTALPLAAAAVGYALLGVAIAIVLVALAVLIFRRPPSREQRRQPLADLPESRDTATSLSARLANTNDAESIARVLVYEALTQLGVDLAAVAQISDDGRLAQGIYAYGPDADNDAWLPRRAGRLAMSRTPSLSPSFSRSMARNGRAAAPSPVCSPPRGFRMPGALT